MPDIFDTLTAEAPKPSGDVFDEISPKPNPWGVPTQVSALASGAARSVAGLANTTSDIANWVLDYGKQLGLPPETHEIFLKKFADVATKSADYWQKKLKEQGGDAVDELVGNVIGGLPAGIAEWGMKVPFAALSGAAEAHKQGKSVISGAAFEGAKRYLLGKLLDYYSTISNPVVRRGLSAATFGAASATESRDPKAIGIQALMGGVMAGKEEELKTPAKASIADAIEQTAVGTPPTPPKPPEAIVEPPKPPKEVVEKKPIELTPQEKAAEIQRLQERHAIMYRQLDQLPADNPKSVQVATMISDITRKLGDLTGEDYPFEPPAMITARQLAAGGEGDPKMIRLANYSRLLTEQEGADYGKGESKSQTQKRQETQTGQDVLSRKEPDVVQKEGKDTGLYEDQARPQDTEEGQGKGSVLSATLPDVMRTSGAEVVPSAPEEPVRIKSPAIQHPDGRVFEGDSHPLIRAANPDAKHVHAKAGFTTTNGDFVGRYAAATIAKKSGQIDKNSKTRALYSEHLKEKQAPEIMSKEGEGPTKTAKVAKFTVLRTAKPSVVNDVASNIMGANMPVQNDALGAILKFFNTGEVEKGWDGVVSYVRGVAGKTAPIMTRFNQRLGEAFTRYISAPIAGEFMAKEYAGKVLETGVSPSLVGAVATENNLRGVRDGFIKAGDEESAAKVNTLVGPDGFFKDEGEYNAAKNNPLVRETIARYKEVFSPVMDDLYKRASEISPDEDLPSRGDLGMRINLKAVRKGDDVAKKDIGYAYSGAGRGNVLSGLKKKSPFARKAKGTAGAYDINLYNIIENTVKRQLEIANQNELYKVMVEEGAAVEGKPGQTGVLIDGEETVPWQIQRRTIVADRDGTKRVIPQNKTLYIRKSLYNEFRRGANVDAPVNVIGLNQVAKVLNSAAIAGLTDASSHTLNLTTAMLTRPGIGGSALREAVAATGGFGDLAVVARNFFKKAIDIARDTPETRQQMSELAQIGAMRSPHVSPGVTSYGGRFLSYYDRVARCVMDDGYKFLVKSVGAEDSETARREFVNQCGQYNRRAQGRMMQILKDMGLSPFITAGKTFTTLGVRNMLADPGVKGTSLSASLALRGLTAARFAGTVGTIMLVNYIRTKDKGGGVWGRPGTPILDIDTGFDDKDGKPIVFGFGSLFGYTRAMRVTGLRATIEGIRHGLTPKQAIQDGLKDIANSLSSPFEGPLVRSISTALTGRPPQLGSDKGFAQRVYPVVPPGQVQFYSDIKHTIAGANPISFAIMEARQKDPKDFIRQVWDFFQRQMPGVVPRPGYDPQAGANLPAIVQHSEVNNFADYITHEARRFNGKDKIDYLHDQVNKVPDQFRQMVFEKLKRDGAFIDDKDPLSFMRTPGASKIKRMRELQVLAK